MRKKNLLKMKRIICLSCFFTTLFLSKAYTQDNNIKNVNDIRQQILTRYQHNADSTGNICWEGCVFIRFSINNGGKISNIDYTSSTPDFIKHTLEKTFIEINNLSHSSKIRPILKNYLLPFQISYQNGCYPPGYFAEGKSTQLTQQRRNDYDWKRNNFNQSQTSVRNIINFSKGSLDSLDCILLAPISIIEMH